MNVIYIEAAQGHAVPKVVMQSQGPFSVYSPTMDPNQEDPPEFPYGATAQNDMRGVGLYTCNACGEEDIRGDALDQHVCGEGEY